jgi:hypothetical protein
LASHELLPAAFVIDSIGPNEVGHIGKSTDLWEVIVIAWGA